MSSIFLSHSHKDKIFARRLGELLRANGVKVWLDEAEMQVGDSLLGKIEEAIRESAYLGVVLSPESVHSQWVQREVQIALNEEFRGTRVKVLPILYKPCDVPGFLSTKIYADLSDDFDAGFHLLLERIHTDLADERHKQKRIAELLQQSYQDWLSFNKHEQFLLNPEQVRLILPFLTTIATAPSLSEYILLSSAQAQDLDVKERNLLNQWLHRLDRDELIALLSLVLKSPSASVQAMCIRVTVDLGISEMGGALINGLMTTKRTSIKLDIIQALEVLGCDIPSGLVESLLGESSDWVFNSFLLRHVPGDSLKCLIVSDQTEFAGQIAQLIQEAGYFSPFGSAQGSFVFSPSGRA